MQQFSLGNFLRKAWSSQWGWANTWHPLTHSVCTANSTGSIPWCFTEVMYAGKPARMVNGQTSDSVYIYMTPEPVVSPLSWVALTLRSCRCNGVLDRRMKEMWSVLPKMPWAPWGQRLRCINSLNPVTRTIIRHYSRHAVNILKWNWITHNTKCPSDGHSVFLDALSEFVWGKSWPEFLGPGACQGRKGMHLKNLLTS